MEGIKRAAYLARHNPGLFVKKLAARACVLKPLPGRPLQRRIRGVTFEFDTSDLIMREAYRNLYELETLDIFRRWIPRGGVYLDVGANVGFLSAIATGMVGKDGEVHAFEPVPRNFEKLARLAELNPEYKIVVNQSAVGSVAGSADIVLSKTENQGLHSLVPNMLPAEWVGETISVPVQRLDAYLRENVRRPVSFIKIDTEGFEFPVLEGLSGYLNETDHRPLVFVEVTPVAWERLGYSLSDLHDWMQRYGYHALNPLNTRARVDVREITEQENVLLVADGTEGRAG
jgi:FkbM family methyltransferase